MNISEVIKQNNENKSGIDWDKFLKEVVECVTPAEVQSYSEGYIDALENVYDWLQEQPRVPTKVLMQLKESITILGGDLNGEE